MWKGDILNTDFYLASSLAAASFLTRALDCNCLLPKETYCSRRTVSDGSKMR